MIVLARTSGTDALHTPVVRALLWLSWLTTGVAAWSTARDLSARDDQDGITSLVLQRGHDAAALSRARSLATVSAVFSVTAPPASVLAVLAVALSDSVALATSRALFALGTLAYVGVLALVLGVSARWAVSLHPRRGRSVFLALILGPHLARSVWPDVPSVPALFAWLLDQLWRLGAVLG
jgi:hypothetical protein